MSDLFCIEESMKQATIIIQKEYPKELAKLAEDIFASSGTSHNRNWTPNSTNTIKRKKGNSPNIETGQLEDWLSTFGNIVDDDYMARLPTPFKSLWGSNGYIAANVLRPFDDIGRTTSDEDYIAEQLAIALQQNLK